jgi:outer membrane protein insertion porin family
MKPICTSQLRDRLSAEYDKLGLPGAGRFSIDTRPFTGVGAPRARAASTCLIHAEFACMHRHGFGPLGIAASLLLAVSAAAQTAPPPAFPQSAYPQPDSLAPLVPTETIGTPAPRQLVTDVVISGSFTSKEYDIQRNIHTRKEREFDPELVQADVRRLVTTGMFRDVKTYTRQAEGGVVVIFEVYERPRIRAIKYLGNRILSEKKLGKEIGVKAGDPLNSYSAEESRRKIEELYHSEGCPQATVSLLEGDKQGDKDLVFLINEGQIERIEAVTFEGNTIASDQRLKTRIQSKPGWFWYLFGGRVDRTKIDADVETLTAYYRSLGFFKARVGRELEFDESGKWLTLRFIIDEGPRYTVRNVTVEGNQKFASQPLLDFLKLKSGTYFDQGAMNRDLNTLVDLYGSQGHVFADVQADPRFLEEPGQLDLVYRIKEGEVFSVGEINVHIAGDFPHTRQTVVLNRLSLRPGDVIDNREVRNSERRLKSSQLFEVNPAEGEPPRIVVRPPDLSSISGLAEAAPERTTIRGQSPEPAPLHRPPALPQVGPYNAPPQPARPY